MSEKPILVLQMQRLGDLVLTFPLLMDLQKRFPRNPVWLAAEQNFFQPLMPFAPNATFFPAGHLPVLAKEKYEMVINLSNRPEAAICAARADAPIKFGPLAQKSGLRIAGFWQLYRAALTQNNRHNAFHWSDLNRLDLGFPLPVIARQKKARPKSGRIGLFIGASEPAKKPDGRFWTNLAARLAGQGLKPLLLGGPAEQAQGMIIASHAGLANANFCGRTSIAQLAALLTTLDLLVTPDTGPMHLADWLGTPVLNLSLGNVHARETGPSSPGQWIARAALSCVGCWDCQAHKLRCHGHFHASGVARLVSSLHEGQAPRPEPGLSLLAAGRDASGLHVLSPLNNVGCRAILENFWQAAFLHFYDSARKDRLRDAALSLARDYPGLAAGMNRHLGKMLATFSKSIKSGKILPANFWKNQPWHTRLFAGHTQMALQNEDFSKSSLLAALGRMAALQEVFAAR